MCHTQGSQFPDEILSGEGYVIGSNIFESIPKSVPKPIRPPGKLSHPVFHFFKTGPGDFRAFFVVIRSRPNILETGFATPGAIVNLYLY